MSVEKVEGRWRGSGGEGRRLVAAHGAAVWRDGPAGAPCGTGMCTHPNTGRGAPHTARGVATEATGHVPSTAPPAPPRPRGGAHLYPSPSRRRGDKTPKSCTRAPDASARAQRRHRNTPARRQKGELAAQGWAGSRDTRGTPAGRWGVALFAGRRAEGRAFNRGSRLWLEKPVRALASVCRHLRRGLAVVDAEDDRHSASVGMWLLHALRRGCHARAVGEAAGDLSSRGGACMQPVGRR